MKFLLPLIFLGALSDAALEDPKQEQRAQEIMREIRCVSCENEPISNSNSEIAADMRHQVRLQVQNGASNKDVRDWFAEKYGDVVIFRPSTTGFGILIWLFPFMLLAGAGYGVWKMVIAKKSEQGTTLTPLPEDQVE